MAVQRRRRLRARMQSLVVGYTKEEGNDETTTSLMESLMGLLRIHVKRGVNLAVRDARSSDPYVVVKMGKQKLKTRMVKRDVNPEWNDELTLSMTDPNIPIKLTVYDHDTFTKDDKMGDAEFEVRSYIEALRKHTNLEEIQNGTVLSRLQPNNNNCLAEESLIYLKDGKILQDLVLRLGNVECGEVEIHIVGPGSQEDGPIASGYHARDPSNLVEEEVRYMCLNLSNQSGSKCWTDVLEENVNQGKSLVEEELNLLKPIVRGKLQSSSPRIWKGIRVS
ncbi:hypothetical protein V6N13_109054 [Hibiscus sabdariffa]